MDKLRQHGSLLFLFGYIGIVLFFREKIPPQEVLLNTLKQLYGSYGYYLVFFGAFLEATFLVSLYVPGSTVILLGAALSKTGVVSFPLVLLLATLGLVMGFCVNYALGRYGWYHVLAKLGAEKAVALAKDKLKKDEYKTMFLGYLHPTGASFVSTAGGVLKMPFRKFFIISIVSQFFWSLLWGGLAYMVGMSLVEFFVKYFGLLVGVVFVIWLIRRFRARKSLVP